MGDECNPTRTDRHYVENSSYSFLTTARNQGTTDHFVPKYKERLYISILYDRSLHLGKQWYTNSKSFDSQNDWVITL